MIVNRFLIGFLNVIYGITGHIDRRIRNGMIFICFLGFAVMFCLFPKPGSDNTRMIIGTVLTVMLAIFSADRKIETARWSKTKIIPVVLFGISILIIRLIHPVGEGYELFAADLILVFPVLYIACINKEKQETMFDLLAAAFLLAGIAAFAYSVLLAFKGQYEIVDGRAAGGAKNPNYLGTIGFMILFSCEYIMIRNRMRLRYLLIFAAGAGVGVSMTLVSVSRAAILSSIISFIFLLVFLMKTEKKSDKGALKNPSWLILAIAIAVIAAFIGVAVPSKQMNSISEGANELHLAAADVSVLWGLNDSFSLSNLESDPMDSLKQRVSGSDDVSVLSSGRTDIWKKYIRYFNMTGNDYDAMVSEMSEQDNDADDAIDIRAHNNIIDYTFRLGIPVGLIYTFWFIGLIVSAVVMLFSDRFTGAKWYWLSVITAVYILYSMVEISTLPFVRCIPALFFLSAGPIMGKSGGNDEEEDAFIVTGQEKFYIGEGVEEATTYVTDKTGYNTRLHILKISKSDSTMIKAVCSGFDSEETDRYKIVSLSKQVEDNEDRGEILAALSGDFFNLRTGAPLGALVMEGQVIKTSEKEPFFAIRNDGLSVIRRAGARTDDVSEAIGGGSILLQKGEILVANDGVRQPRQAIGKCKDGTVVIVNAEGRQPDTRGLSLYDLACFMKQLGCITVLNLDGGGSAGFMTKRLDDEKPAFRNMPGDGFERSISSALLIVSDKNENRQPNPKYEPYKRSYLQRSIAGNYGYMINGEGASGIYNINGQPFLFEKGKGISKTVSIGEINYKFRKGMFDGSSDPDSGDVVFGFCGCDECDNKNLIFALHQGNGVLNIGVNSGMYNMTGSGDGEAVSGEMDDWMTSQERCLPWYAFRHQIKKVYIAEGVTSVGSKFLSMPKGKIKGGTDTPLCELEEVILPASLERIGAYAFYNKPLLKSIKISSRNIELGEKAFDQEVRFM